MVVIFWWWVARGGCLYEWKRINATPSGTTRTSRPSLSFKKKFRVNTRATLSSGQWQMKGVSVCKKTARQDRVSENASGALPVTWTNGCCQIQVQRKSHYHVSLLFSLWTCLFPLTYSLWLQYRDSVIVTPSKWTGVKTAVSLSAARMPRLFLLSLLTLLFPTRNSMGRLELFTKLVKVSHGFWKLPPPLIC